MTNIFTRCDIWLKMPFWLSSVGAESLLATQKTRLLSLLRCKSVALPYGQIYSLNYCRHYLDFFTKIFVGDFKGAFDSLLKAGEAFKNVFLGVWATIGNGIIEIFEKAINWVIGALNKIHFDLPDWLPGNLAGKSFGFNLSPVSLTRIQVPKLAAGAVIPPNAPFLAQLGDQKHGTNLEAPEGLIRQIIREELSGFQFGDPQINISAQGDLAQFIRLIRFELNKENSRVGTTLIHGI